MLSIKKYFFIVTTMLLSGCGDPVIIAPDAILPDGSKYLGNIESGKFQGKGKLVYPNGAYYDGQFVNGAFHGEGKFVYSTGEVYQGEFQQGTFTGHGTMSNDKGETYEGNFSEGLYHGKGKHTLSTGGIYEGEFKKGLYNGRGHYQIEDYSYEGDFKDGVFSGKGSYRDYSGSEYIGDVENWTANGTGQKTDAEGTVIKGEFENGYASGQGTIINADGSQYDGEMSYDRPEGIGRMVYSNGDVYDGEFSYGSRYGDGTLVKAKTDTQKQQTLSGTWSGDTLIHNIETGERQHDQAAIALETHQTNLSSALNGLSPSDKDQTNVYFLGVAGDGSQSVFKREIEFVAPLMESRYSTQGRSVLLVNHHHTAADYPLATDRSIAEAINGIAAKMDTENDIFFTYLTSHGSKKHKFYLNHNSIKLNDLAADELARTLKAAKIKWKVIIISACYAGGFIPELKDDYTLIVAAADAESKSFGCSEESEMTYFGRAFFKETLAVKQEASLPEAFDQAKALVSEWESTQDKKPSNPVIHAPEAIVLKLSQLLNK